VTLGAVTAGVVGVWIVTGGVAIGGVATAGLVVVIGGVVTVGLVVVIVGEVTVGKVTVGLVVVTVGGVTVGLVIVTAPLENDSTPNIDSKTNVSRATARMQRRAAASNERLAARRIAAANPCLLVMPLRTQLAIDISSDRASMQRSRRPPSKRTEAISVLHFSHGLAGW
jgi:hypothetical protein